MPPDAGLRVRVVRRSPAPVPFDGVEVVPSDAMDRALVAETTRDAEVVYPCTNSPYFAKAWAETLPRIQANLVAGAGRAARASSFSTTCTPMGGPTGNR